MAIIQLAKLLPFFYLFCYNISFFNTILTRLLLVLAIGGSLLAF
jgi:hypothetical protein